jgi:RNA polymerase sigma-70 factor (ECF subfamily)
MDEQARFERLYVAHAGAVRTYVRRRFKAHAADDVVADVFLVAWRRLGEVPDDPLPWLLGVARRVLANRRRSAVRDAALRGRIQLERDSAEGWPRGSDDLSETVMAALERLGEPDREALLLVAWEGLTPGQAAAALGVRANTFSARLSRAKRRFEKALAQQRAGQQPTQNKSHEEVSK